MKKFLAILTVMTMALTTLVVPTVAFAEGNSNNGQNQIDVGIQINGNGGTFNFKYTDGSLSDAMNGRGENVTIDETDSITVGELIGKVDSFKKNEGDGNVIAVSDLVSGAYWTNRAFIGWEIYADMEVEDRDGNFIWERVTLAEVSKDADIMNTSISVKGAKYITIKAVWEGNDSDYMVSVNFTAMDGAGFEVIPTEGDSWEQQGWADMFKKYDVAHKTIGQQLEDFGIKEFSTPVRDNDTFEGWLMTDENGQILFDKLYTFEEIKTHMPSYDVQYIAKWASISEEEYHNMFGSGDGPGGPDGPMEPFVEAKVTVNGQEIKSEPIYEFVSFAFECEKDDEVVLSIDLSDITDINTVSWIKDTYDEDVVLSGASNDGDIFSINLGKITKEDIDNYDYLCKVGTESGEYIYTFSPVSELPYEGASYTVPENIVIVNYGFYNKEGRYDGFPISISLDDVPDTVTNLDELVEHYGESLESIRFDNDALPISHWEVTGYSGEVGDGSIEALGGQEIYAVACYEDPDKAPVQVEVIYYDKYGKQRIDETVVVVDDQHNTTTEYVYNAVKSKLDAIKHCADYEFTGEWSYREGVINEAEDSYFGPLQIEAVYKKQPINITCSYKENGKVVTVSDEYVVSGNIDGELDLIAAFEEWLSNDETGKTIPTDAVKEWGFNPRFRDSDEKVIDVAAIYENETPVYVARDILKYDDADGSYYYIEGFVLGNDPEIVYVDSKYPEGEIHWRGKDSYSKKVCDAVAKEFGDNPSRELKLEKYDMRGVEYYGEIITSNYRVAPEYMFTAIYDKVYVEIVGSDGSVETKFVDPKNKNENPYKIGTAGNGEVWNLEVPHMGGTSIPGGSYIDVAPPFAKFSMWTLSQTPLEEVPSELTGSGGFESVDEIQDEMDEDAIAAKPTWNDAEIQSEHYDVELFRVVSGELVRVEEKDFLDKNGNNNGIWVMLAYPEGTDKNTDFVITHMFTKTTKVGNKTYNPGDIEVISGNRVVKTAKGIKVKMYSLSPMSIAYDPTAVSNDGSGEDGSTTPDSSVNTGDDFSAIPYIAVMVIALAGVATALFRRKTVK